MAVEILEVMDECLVAKNAGTIIKRTLARARDLVSSSHSVARDTSSVTRGGNEEEENHGNRSSMVNDAAATSFPDLDPMRFFNPFTDSVDGLETTGEGFLRLEGDSLANDAGQASFWTEWENSLDLLGSS